MPYVYRVQNEKGQGPYADFMLAWNHYGDDRGLWLRGHDNDRNEYPIPRHDGLDITRAHRCGFKNLTQLQRWFTAEELRRLERFGFRVVRIKARSVQSSERQAIFIPETACDYSKSGADK